MRKNTVFTAFLNGEEEIDFLPVDGTTVKGQRKIKALMKFKAGLKRASQLRRTASDLTIHAHPNDFDDELKSKVAPLLKKAVAITIAKEPQFFEACRTQEGYTVEEALTQLMDFIKETLE